MPETFSSELGDVHEQNQAGSSFTNEFRGASDSLIERDRPPRPSDVGRRARRVLLVVVLLAALLGGGGWALWYWSEPIGEWIASWNSSDDQAPAEPSEPAQPVPPESEPPSEPEPLPVVDSDPPVTPPPVTPPPPTPGELPVEPLDKPPGELPVEPIDTPSKPASVKSGATSVRGKVATASVNSRLKLVDTALEGCWASAAAKPGTKRPATVTLRFGIKWNGRTFAIAVEGDAPTTVTDCVRKALPSAGWPQPRDGGEATVTRSWSLE